MIPRLTIEHARKAGELRDGKCLSLDYKNARTKLIWECNKGHKWEASLDNVKSGKWCPICAKESRKNAESKIKNRLLQLENSKLIANSKGGKCLSETYKYCGEKLEFECHLGHRWEVLYKDLKKGSWCPYCGKNVQEFIIRSVLEYLLETKIVKHKPKDLLNYNGNRMEFDFWNEEINFAGEHHGRQHFQTNEFVKTQIDLNKRKIDDQIKRDYCKSNNIKYFESVDLNFLKLNTFVDIIEVTNYVRQKLLNLNYNPKSGSPKIELKDFYTDKNRLLKIKNIAKDRGGECLSEKYINNYSKMKFKCKNNHVWLASFSHIREGRWCPICAGRKINNEIDR